MKQIIMLKILLLLLLCIFMWYYYTPVTALIRNNRFLANLLLKNYETSAGDKSKTNSETTGFESWNEMSEKTQDQTEEKITEKSHTVKHTSNATEVNSDRIKGKNQFNIIKYATSDQQHPSKLTTIKYSSVTNETTFVPTTQTTFLTENHSTDKYQDNSAWTAVHMEPVRGENHIIFLETRCVLNDTNTTNKSGLIINQRGACAVASAAKMNPYTKVYLIYTCSINGRLGDSPEYVKQMLSYPNVRIWKLDISGYIKDTPLENWDFMGKVNSSKWPLSHSSDILRYLTLWKYGGTYLDQDFVILKSLNDLGTNYAGAQSEGYIASGALNFNTDTAGRTVAHLCILDLQRNFNGQSWGQNGPAVITRVLEHICGTKSIALMTRKECLGFIVLPQNVFYTIPYQSWREFYDESRSNGTMKKVEGSYGAHVWNKMSSQENITVGSKQAYGLLAEKHCPHVYSNCGPTF